MKHIWNISIPRSIWVAWVHVYLLKNRNLLWIFKVPCNFSWTCSKILKLRDGALLLDLSISTKQKGTLCFYVMIHGIRMGLYFYMSHLQKRKSHLQKGKPSSKERNYSAHYCIETDYHQITKKVLIQDQLTLIWGIKSLVAQLSLIGVFNRDIEDSNLPPYLIHTYLDLNMKYQNTI